jgi:putative transposase
VSKETISRITDKVTGEMSDWCNRPLDGVYAAIFVDAVVVKVRSGTARSPTGPSTPRSASASMGRRTSWACGPVRVEGAKFWMSVLTDLKNRGVGDVFFLVCDGLKGLPEVAGTCGR